MARTDYDFWLFDLDGTIVDIEPSYPSTVVSAVGDRLGVSFTEREAEILWYGLGGVRERVLRRRGVDPERFWETFHEVEQPGDRAGATYLYDDAESFICEIDAPVGVVTHCQPYLTDPVLERLDIRDWFDTVVCCSDETGWKPDPTPVEMAMTDLGVAHDGHEGVLAGDDPDDIGAAWNAGLDAIHVERYDPAERGQCVLGDRRVTGFGEMS
ncbi:HAD family hydrolase [Halomicrobium sp. LC1Hm]|uniref:HAD family hydrolase n=1 Tax=Halomicrobium sp. LC1Hm TaxID=2610902 RepID=UPI0012983386|nr:HAD family hydrolase [Halomicrobium sp. LC1Hm]QGA81719.1 Phosphoglycolate phosphatase [Halomicrobium sp. LC1Hm]